MTATLGDSLLVLLADRPATAYELQKRHAQTLGPQHAVDVRRIGTTLQRLERQGYVRTLAPAAVTIRRTCTVTDAGQRRQHAWILDVPAGITAPEAVDRILLATAATDRETFEAVVGACLIALRPRRRGRSGAAHSVVSAGHALEEFEAAVTASTITWARHLLERRRERDPAPAS